LLQLLPMNSPKILENFAQNFKQFWAKFSKIFGEFIGSNCSKVVF
jgi:hypothetical protein